MTNAILGQIVQTKWLIDSRLSLEVGMGICGQLILYVRHHIHRTED